MMSFEPESEIKTTLIKVADAYLAFSRIIRVLRPGERIKAE
jgi:hypothetical protein